MSDVEYSQDQEVRKKRRNADSCDSCKKKKIKCKPTSVFGPNSQTLLDALAGDSATRPGNVCSSCLAYKTECTHISASAKKKHGPPKGMPRGQRTIPSIVNSILSTSNPYEPPTDSVAVKGLLVDLAEHIKSLDAEISGLQSSSCGPASETTANTQLTFSSSSPPPTSSLTPGSYLDDINAVENLTEGFKTLSVDHPKDRHFGGQSSYMLLKLVIDIKKEYNEEDPPNTFDPVPIETETTVKSDYKRPEFWTVHPWQILPTKDSSPFIFPDSDLLDSLVSLYFTHINAS
ncbi:hypothetical protein BT96DRAFT_1004110 [Gymnopus androsaceus JB14]|uniref:Zn(2)-C6 fungal-type domain-containing protein n=1 Tax=Gymnopus androsaceus JB14 TaxID=1447944 RepID=A0A6A4GT03_9AGAR|nr:hypothetical protein BT96DRAFT_1004110 [Gymnopus androsaceus JB14]